MVRKATEVSNPLDQLRLWQRFHIRLTALYGGAVFFTLAVMGVLTYQHGVNTELEGLRQRLLATATSVSQTVDADGIAKIPVDSETMTPLHANLLAQFGRIANADADIDSLYILRPTREPTKLRFLVDYAKEGEFGAPGQLYWAGDVPLLLKGFEEPVVEPEPVFDEYGLSISGYAPLVTSDGRTVGVVGVDVLVSRLDLLKNRVLVVIGSLFGVAALLVSLVSLFVARSIRNPLTLMVDATTAIASGKLDTHLGITRHDEFGVLAHHFDHMAKDLRERQYIRDTFGRYVSEDVARALLTSGHAPTLGGEERVVTILFSDLRDYTTISEHMSPAQMVDMLNKYLSVMNAVIDEHRGCVIEFLGDAILAVFGAPQYYPEHAECALRCAIKMRECLKELNHEWEKHDLAQLWQKAGVAQLEARIGLHTGSVVAGNLGSPTRMKYTVIGDSVNVAARLENLNKEFGTSILLSDGVRAHLPSEHAIEMEDRGSHVVKGRQQSIRVFSV